MKIETPQRLCHLPLVMDVLRRSRVLKVIDKAIVQHPLSPVSTGECVAVILAGVFVGAHSLWRIRERLAPYDVHSLGSPNIHPTLGMTGLNASSVVPHASMAFNCH